MQRERVRHSFLDSPATLRVAQINIFLDSKTRPATRCVVLFNVRLFTEILATYILSNPAIVVIRVITSVVVISAIPAIVAIAAVVATLGHISAASPGSLHSSQLPVFDAGAACAWQGAWDCCSLSSFQ